MLCCYLNFQQSCAQILYIPFLHLKKIFHLVNNSCVLVRILLSIVSLLFKDKEKTLWMEICTLKKGSVLEMGVEMASLSLANLANVYLTC